MAYSLKWSYLNLFYAVVCIALTIWLFIIGKHMKEKQDIIYDWQAKYLCIIENSELNTLTNEEKEQIKEVIDEFKDNHKRTKCALSKFVDINFLNKCHSIRLSLKSMLRFLKINPISDSVFVIIHISALIIIWSLISLIIKINNSTNFNDSLDELAQQFSYLIVSLTSVYSIDRNYFNTRERKEFYQKLCEEYKIDLREDDLIFERDYRNYRIYLRINKIILWAKKKWLLEDRMIIFYLAILIIMVVIRISIIFSSIILAEIFITLVLCVNMLKYFTVCLALRQIIENLNQDASNPESVQEDISKRYVFASCLNLIKFST